MEDITEVFARHYDATPRPRDYCRLLGELAEFAGAMEARGERIFTSDEWEADTLARGMRGRLVELGLKAKARSLARVVGQLHFASDRRNHVRMADVRLVKHEALLAIAFAALFLASPAVAEDGATTGDLRSHCLSHDPILHQQCFSYIAGVYEMTVLMGEVYELFNDPVARLAEHGISVCYGNSAPVAQATKDRLDARKA
jgi:hypothetical protein